MRVEFRLDYPTNDLLDFLDYCDYPYQGWTLDMFQRVAFITRLQTVDRERIGYIWYTLMPDTYRIFEGHVAIDPKYHGRWFSRRTNKQMLNVARFLDARLMVLFWKDPVPLLKMRRLGWTVAYPFAWIEIGEEDGKFL